MNKSKSITAESQLSHTLTVLNKIGKSLIDVQDPSKVLNQIAKDAKTVLGADIVDLYEYNHAKKEFVLPPIMVGTRRDTNVTKDNIYDDDVVVKVVKSGKPQYFADAQSTSLLIKDFNVPREDAPNDRFVIREGVVSSVSLPLKTGEETVGVMFVNFRTRQAFDDEQKNLIETFSNLAAIAIRNARLWKQETRVVAALKNIIDVIGTKEEPLSAILEQTITLFSANNGSVSRLTEDGQYLQHKVRWAEGKLDKKTAEDPYVHPINKGITGYVVQRGLSFRTGDVSKVKFYDPWNLTTKSELAIPLRNVFGGIIGVLNLESDFVNFFTEEDQRLSESFAHAVSAAIQQSDLVENIQSLHYLTESHSLKDLLGQVLKNLAKMMGENTAASVNLYDSKNDLFYAFDGIGPNREFIDQYLLTPPRQEGGTGRYVLQTKTPLFYEDVNNIPVGQPKIRDESKKYQIASFAVLPLLYQDDIVGALFIHKIKDQIKFTEDSKRILLTYANQAALAIYNSRRLVNVDVLDAILKATVLESRESILNLIVEKTVTVMGSDYASIWLSEADTGDLVRKAIYVRTEEQAYLKPGTERLENGQKSINMTVFKERKPSIINDVDQAEKEGRYNRIYKKAQSEISVPLIFRDDVIGTLNAESQYLGAYSDFDKVTLRIFADIATVAIKVVQNRDEINQEVQRKTDEARRRSEELFHMNYRLERKNASFEALTEIGHQLTANVQRGEQEILSIVHQQASRIMDTGNMYIALYEPETDKVHFELAFIDGVPIDIQNEPQWAPRSGGNGRTEWIIRNKTPILTYTKVDAVTWYEQPNAQNYIGQTFASWLGVPIMFGEEVLGVVATYNKTEEYKYDPDDLRILSLMGRQAAIALQNARLISKLDTVRELGEDLSSSLSI